MNYLSSKLGYLIILLSIISHTGYGQHSPAEILDSLVLDYSFVNDSGFFVVENVSESLGELKYGAYLQKEGLYFDGTDDELLQPKSDYTLIDGNEISILAWIKADGTDSINTILSKFYAYELRVIDGFLELELTLNGYVSFLARTEDPCIHENQLHHVAVVRKNNNVYFYVDTILKNTEYLNEPSSENLYPANNNIYIGSAREKEWFDGEIYDVSVYKLALGFEDIDSIVNGDWVPNQLPIIDAGPNLFFSTPTNKIPLRGTAIDYHGEVVETQWKQISGEPLQIINDTIEYIFEGEFGFRFVAYDNQGDSASQEIILKCYNSSESIAFVSPFGNDTTGLGTITEPYRTINYPINLHQGDYHKTIHLLPGDYIVKSKIKITDGISLIGSGINHTKIIPDSSLYSEFKDIDSSFILIEDIKNYGRFGYFSIDGCNKQLNIGIAFKDVNNVEISNINIYDTYFSGLGLVDVSNSVVHDVYLENTSWGSTGYSSGAIVMGNIENVDIYDIKILEGLRNKPTNWGYGIKAYSIEGSTYLKKLRIFNSEIETNNKGFWNNGEAPNISIEFHSTSFDSCEIFNATVNNTISLVPNVLTPNSKNLRLHHNVILSPGGVPIESYMRNCEIDHNYIIGEYTTIKGFNNNTYEDYLVHHNIFTDQFPKTGNSQAISYGALKNLKFYNNTCYFTRLNNVTGIEFFSGLSENVEVINNIFYSKTSDGEPKVVELKNDAEINNLIIRSNTLFNYSLVHQPNIEDTNYYLDPNLQWIKTESNWMPIASDTSWLVDSGDDVGLPFTGEAPDIGAGEGNVGLSSCPVINIVQPYDNLPVKLFDTINVVVNVTDAIGVKNLNITLNDSIILAAEQNEVNTSYMALNPGKNVLKFTATNLDGLTSFKSIHYNVGVKLDSITIIQNGIIQLKVGQDTVLNYLVYPENATNKDVNWFSADPNIASVDASGCIKGVELGETSIYLNSVDGQMQSEISIEVSDHSGIYQRNKDLTKLQIWPNPNYNKYLNIHSDFILAGQKYKVKIFQINGSILLEEDIVAKSGNLLRVDLSNIKLNNSMVLISIFTENDICYTRKLILRK